MKFSDIKSVLSFAAFRPEPDDRSAAWSKRFPHQRTLLLNVSRTQTTWRQCGKGGRIFDGGNAAGDFAKVAEQCAAEWRAGTEDGWCAVSLNTRYVISLENNLSRKPGFEEIIRTNPRAVLGSRYERGKRYTLLHNPESVASVLLSIDEELIKKIEQQVKDVGLQVGRVCCGSYAMLVRLLEMTNRDDGEKKRNGESPKAKTRLYVVCCEGSVCALLQSGELWSELRSRSDLYSTDLEPVLTLVLPLASRLDGDGEILVAADGPDSGVAEILRERFPSLRVEDLSQPDHLWRVLAEVP